MTLSFSYNSEEPAPWSESEYITSIVLTRLLVLPIKKITSEFHIYPKQHMNLAEKSQEGSSLKCF